MVNQKPHIVFLRNIAISLIVLCLSVVSALAQMNNVNEIRNHFDTYQTHNLQEKVFVHTDKDFYMVDEIVWFKIYLVDGIVHKPLGLSKVVYVEILDNNKSVLQAKIPMAEGFGNGSFFLPNSLKSGHYTFRAYTSWMKNFSPDFYFEKEISIINLKKTFALDSLTESSKTHVGIFPEGGNLVEGFESKVAFHVMRHGKGISANGIIKNELGDTLVRFQSHKFGLGTFLFNPEKGHSYQAVFALETGEILNEKLPKIFEKGMVMGLKESLDDIIIEIKGSGKDDFNLLVHSKGVIESIIPIKAEGRAVLEKANLASGISHITLINAEGEPICERLYFKYPEELFTIDLNINKNSFGTREKVVIDLSTKTKEGKPLSAHMSMAVYHLDSLQSGEDLNINTYLWLISDLAGKVESPSYYFEQNSPEAMDNLMLTHGWRRFKWGNVFSEIPVMHQFLPEYAGHLVNAVLMDKISNERVSGVQSYITVPSKRMQFKTGMSDEKGRVKFEMKDFYSNDEIILKSDADNLYNVAVSSPFSMENSTTQISDFILNDYNEQSLRSQFKNTEVIDHFFEKNLESFKLLILDTTAFYAKADIMYKLDDYVRFSSMEDVLREYVTPVTVRKRDGKFFLAIYNDLTNQSYQTEPLILLDGLPIFDTDKLMAYNPKNVERLEIINRQYYLGNLAFNGILNFITYKGDLPNYRLDPHTTVIDYQGLQKKRDFYAPIYDTQEQVNSRLPDFRTLLLWTPEIKTNEQGTGKLDFYTSDIPGKYLIVIEGITANGESGSKMFELEVNQN